MGMKEESTNSENTKINSIVYQINELEDDILTLYKDLAEEKDIRGRIPLLIKDIRLPDNRKRVSIARGPEGLIIEIELPNVSISEEQVAILDHNSSYRIISKDITEDNHEVFSKVNCLREAYYRTIFPEAKFEFIEDEFTEEYMHKHLLYAKHRETEFLILLDVWIHEETYD